MTLSNFCENIKFVGLFLKLFSGWQGTFHIISNKNPETINSFIAVLYEINQELWHDDKLKKNLEAWQYLQHFWSDKYVKGTVVNKTWSFLHGESHEITLTVPLSFSRVLKEVYHFSGLGGWKTFLSKLCFFFSFRKRENDIVFFILFWFLKFFISYFVYF